MNFEAPISLLYVEKEEKSDRSMKNSVTNLLIDKIVANITQDITTQTYIMNVLSNPLYLVKNIKYRQDIFKALIKNSGLYAELELMLNEFSTLKKEWSKTKSSKFNANYGRSKPVSSGVLEKDLHDDMSEMYKFKLCCDIILRYIELYKRLEALTEEYVNDNGFGVMNARMKTFTKDENFKEFENLVQEFIKLDMENAEYIVNIDMDYKFELISSNLKAIISVSEEEDKKAVKLFWQKEKKERKYKPKDGDIVIDAADKDTQYRLRELIYADIDNISDKLSEVINYLQKPFENIKEDLVFYKFGLEFYNILRSFTEQFCFPQIYEAEEDCVYYTNLRDLYISMELFGKYGKRENNIIPNDIWFDKKLRAMLVKGENSSGKTVYLRSIGIAQFFGQAGFPVCAAAGTISVRKHIFTQFSSEEKDLGRFEEEVKEVSEIFDKISKYDMVLFNETFQSTSYSEAVNGLCDILYVFSKLDCKTVFVTHITEMFDKVKELNSQLENGIIKASKSGVGKEKYKVKEMELN